MVKAEKDRSFVKRELITVNRMPTRKMLSFKLFE